MTTYKIQTPLLISSEFWWWGWFRISGNNTIQGLRCSKTCNKNYNVDVCNAGWLFIIKEDVDTTPLGQNCMACKVYMRLMNAQLHIYMGHGWLFLVHLFAICYLVFSHTHWRKSSSVFLHYCRFISIDYPTHKNSKVRGFLVLFIVEINKVFLQKYLSHNFLINRDFKRERVMSNQLKQLPNCWTPEVNHLYFQNLIQQVE